MCLCTRRFACEFSQDEKKTVHFQELTETELELYEEQIDFPTFIELLTRHFCMGKAEEDLQRAFQVFDREEEGVISENELRHALTNLGNVLSLSEVDDLLEGVGERGSVPYSKLVDKLDSEISK